MTLALRHAPLCARHKIEPLNTSWRLYAFWKYWKLDQKRLQTTDLLLICHRFIAVLNNVLPWGVTIKFIAVWILCFLFFSLLWKCKWNTPPQCLEMEIRAMRHKAFRIQPFLHMHKGRAEILLIRGGVWRAAQCHVCLFFTVPCMANPAWNLW